MAIRVDPGRIVLTDATDTDVVFDSDEALFSCKLYTGSFSLGSRSATTSGFSGTSNYEAETDHVLQAVVSGYDTVTGGFKVTTSTPTGVANLGWFNAGGTYVHYLDPTSAVLREGTGENWYLSSFVAYTFMIVGTNLVMRESILLRAQGTGFNKTNTITLLPVTLDYKLFCGKFI